MTMIKTIDVIPCSSTNPKAIKAAKEFPAKLKDISGDTIRIVKGSVYSTWNTKVNVVCMTCSHQWKSTPNRLKNSRGCPECAKKRCINSAGTRRSKRADRETKQKAAELRASGLSYKKIGKELGFAQATIQRWLDKGQYERQLIKKREHNKKSKASGHQAKLNAAYYQTPHGKASAKKGEHKRRSLKLHAVDSIYIGNHPEADAQGFVEVDMWSYITPEDFDFWSFDGANDDVAKRAKQQQGLEKISGEKYSLEHLVPLSKGGLHHPLNFANRALTLNLQKNDKMLPDDVRLFAKRLFS